MPVQVLLQLVHWFAIAPSASGASSSASAFSSSASGSLVGASSSAPSASGSLFGASSSAPSARVHCLVQFKCSF